MKLLLCLAALVPLVLAGEAPTLSIPEAYSTTGRIIMPYADIVEPFNVSVDLKAKKALYSFYADTARMYYRADEDDYGNVYKLVYETMNKTVVNKLACFKLPGEKELPVAVQSILPDTKLFKYANDSVVDGIKVQIFVYVNSVNNKTNTYSLAIRTSDHTPYLLYFLGYDIILGSHYDEYAMYYDHFSAETPSSKLFDLPKDSKCGGFPGPGSTHLADNPFHELLGSAGNLIDDKFSGFKQKYNRKYNDDTHEHALRRKNFHHNYRFINSVNRQPLTYKLAVNHLTDLTKDEVKTMRGYRNTGINSKYIYEPSLKGPPPSADWWIRGAVTPVKDQGICGSCWSFGTTGTLEGSLFIKTGRLVSLSEQAFVDCSWGQGNNGCDGGESERAYEWMLKNGCLPTEQSYGQYMMQDGKCHVDKAICGANITKYFNTKSGDVDDLRSAIAENGPISVAIDASQPTFSFYSHGVYYDKKCGNGVDDLDHQVLAVGYGSQDGQTYWLVKNSWSTHWGMDGYVLMSDKDNNCGVATDASFAVIA